jgi:flagellar protein FliO/FliZ
VADLFFQYIGHPRPACANAAIVTLCCLLLSTRSLAQTTAPATPQPPAIQGAYEHDTLRRPGAASATVASEKTITTDSSATGTLDFRRVVLSLGIVLALIFACRWASRYFFPSTAVGRSSQVIKILSRSVIAPKQQLLLIQVGRRLVVVGDSGQQMNALAEISDPDEVASLLGQLSAPVPESETSFDPLLGRARRQFDEPSVSPAMDSDDDEAELAIAGVDETRGELSGLTEKIRTLSRQLGKM